MTMMMMMMMMMIVVVVVVCGIGDLKLIDLFTC